MKKTFKESLLLIAFGVVLFVGLEHLNIVADFAVGIFRLITPVFAGLMLAFVLNVPISGMESGTILSRLSSRRITVSSTQE